MEEVVSESQTSEVTSVNTGMGAIPGHVSGPIAYFVRTTDGALSAAEAEAGALVPPQAPPPWHYPLPPLSKWQ